MTDDRNEAERQHDAWMAQARGEAPVTKSLGSETRAAGNVIATGLTWTDKAGGEHWSTGNQVFEKIDKDIAARFAKQKEANRDQLEALTEALIGKFVEVRDALRANVQGMLLEARTEILAMREANAKLVEENERLMKQHPRLVKSG